MTVFWISDMFRSYWMCWCHAKLSPLLKYTNRNGWNNDDNDYKTLEVGSNFIRPRTTTRLGPFYGYGKIVEKLKSKDIIKVPEIWKAKLVFSMRLPTLQKKKKNARPNYHI
uniref:Uncharacterized protein n=1 Tax=Glossina austeni TaxID=7395 RepID=A0A1A9VAD1_GLOAU